MYKRQDKDSDIDDFKSDPNDPLRALDGKLADALARIAKGEPARRIALEAERAALSADLLSGRQTLWMIYVQGVRARRRHDRPHRLPTS